MLDQMPHHMGRVMSCKRLALLQRIIEDEGYEDTNLAADMAAGFSLVGQAPSSGGRLPEKFVPANLHVGELMDGSSKARSAVRLATTSSGDAEMDSKLWLKVLEETDRGWLIGPLSWAELEEYAVVSKRFPIQQGAKLRPIDDFSMSMVNATVSVRDQATDGVDIIAATMCVFMQWQSRAGVHSSWLVLLICLQPIDSCVCGPIVLSLCLCQCVQSWLWWAECISTGMHALWFSSGCQRLYPACKVHSMDCCKVPQRLRRATTMTSLWLAHQSLVRVVMHACPCS